MFLLGLELYAAVEAVSNDYSGAVGFAFSYANAAS
jgi:hypothetical protein